MSFLIFTIGFIYQTRLILLQFLFFYVVRSEIASILDIFFFLVQLVVYMLSVSGGFRFDDITENIHCDHWKLHRYHLCALNLAARLLQRLFYQWPHCEDHHLGGNMKESNSCIFAMHFSVDLVLTL